MTQIKTFVFNPFQENTYVVYDESKECVIVDSGCHSKSEQNELVDFIESNGLRPKYAINTHGHIDHVLGSAFVKSHFKVDIMGHPEDLTLMQSAVNHGLMYGISIDEVPLIDININDGDTITFGNSSLEVIHTPGHSQGGICLLSKKGEFVISGDTLFNGSIGRTDLPGGNYDQLISSINKKLLTLNKEYRVYPGHGEPTTIEWEKQNNPFLTKQ
ncbi:MAG: MBL fold hydrolase [Bacteroidetes bacterium HGW-Bacteroidetes-15]|nr:MAG: MBL fold hydrolase [Bacteroidetes bacterium HGW-Bacteroidetes-15]